MYIPQHLTPRNSEGHLLEVSHRQTYVRNGQATFKWDKRIKKKLKEQDSKDPLLSYFTHFPHYFNSHKFVSFSSSSLSFFIYSNLISEASQGMHGILVTIRSLFLYVYAHSSAFLPLTGD